jgi:RNA polymerase sigma factor (sigma-70 family)
VERYSDEELLYLIRCGQEAAKEHLIDKYKRRIYNWIRYLDYSYLGIEHEDLLQIGIIRFWEGLDLYRNDQSASLYTFSKMIVMQKIKTILRQSVDKHTIKDMQVISLDEMVGDNGLLYEEIIEDERIVYQPSKILAVKETTSEYFSEIEKRMTFVERTVSQYIYEGYNEKEIAEMLNIPIKSVYNAVYRSHKKSSLTKEIKCDKL